MIEAIWGLSSSNYVRYWSIIVFSACLYISIYVVLLLFLYSVFGIVNQLTKVHSIHQKLVVSQLIAVCKRRTTELVITNYYYLRRETGEALAPHFHQLTTLRVVIPIKSLLVQRQSPVSHSYTVDDVYFHQRLQIQFRFDNTKHFRATENPISTSHFSQQPMPTRTKARCLDGEDPAHWTLRLKQSGGK